MAKKFFKKTLSVGLSLALCASMVAPAFAASFADVNTAINSTDESGTSNGVSWSTSDEQRNVTLNDTVTYGGENDDESIVIDGKDVILNLNGNTIDGGYRAEKKDEAGNVTQEGSEGSGHSVITVKNGANVTVDGADEDGKMGTITGGNSLSGGGVNVSDSSFTMKNGVVTGNSAGTGGGISVENGSLELENVDINKNQAELKHDEYGNGYGNGGGGIDIDASDVKLKDVTISENESVGMFDPYGDGVVCGFGGGVEINSCQDNTIELENVSITGNKAFANGGGMEINNAGNVSMKDVTITDNHSGTGGGGIFIYTEGDTVINMENTAVYDNDAYDSYNRKQANDMSVWTEDWRNLQGKIDLESDPETSVEGKGMLDGWTNCWPNEGEDPEFSNELMVGEGQFIDLVSRWATPETPESPEITDPDDDLEINDPAIPLASGPITRAQFIDYLWRHEGEPASAGVCTFTDVEDTHQYFDALCWGDENGVAEAYFNAEGHEDGTFEPDELVTAGAAREFLTNFETVFGMRAVAAANLATLRGADDEALLNCDEVLAEFFGEVYAPAEDNDIEIAA